MNYKDEIWGIYINSFPENERRSYKNQKEIMNNPLYFIKPILKDNLIGFIATWELSKFTFIEHYALKDDERGKGYGTKFLENFVNQNRKLIILEVEIPNTKDAMRRIEFYKKLSFHLNEFEYYQPALNENTSKIPLMIMSYPYKLKKEQFISIRDELYKQVYNNCF